MPFLKALSPTTYLVILIAIITIALGWKLNSDKKEIKKLETAVVVKDVQIKAQDNAIEVDKVVDRVKEEVNTQVAKEVKEVARKQHQVVAKQEHQERVIIQKYEQTPATVDNVLAKQNELSHSRIDAAWETYCIAQPNAAECQAPPIEGENHA